MYLLKPDSYKECRLAKLQAHPPEALTVLGSNQIQANTPTHPQPHTPRFKVQRLLGNFNHLTNVTSLHQVIQVCLSFRWEVQSVPFLLQELHQSVEVAASRLLLAMLVIPLW